MQHLFKQIVRYYIKTTNDEEFNYGKYFVNDIYLAKHGIKGQSTV